MPNYIILKQIKFQRRGVLRIMKRILVLIIIGIAVLSACNQQKESEKKKS